MTLKQIQPDEVKYSEFPETAEFQILNDHYKVTFTKPSEIGMTYYVRNVEVLKNDYLFTCGLTCDTRYLDLVSPDKKFMFIPFEDSYEVFNLQTGGRYKDGVRFLLGNQFDKTGRYLLTVGDNEYKLMDLENNKSILTSRNEKNRISGACFGFDNLIWTIKADGNKQIIKKINPFDLQRTFESIPSPFDFFRVDKSKYKKLVDLNSHCLWISKGGGMLHSSLLNSWQFVKTNDGTVYKSVIPTSDIRYSKNYNTYTCDIDFFYVVIEE